MKHFVSPYYLGRQLALLLGLLVGGGFAARAQAPAWQLALSGSSNQPTAGTSQARATATDAAGNVFVTGSFTGQVAFGSTLLTSSQGGGSDIFIAKWNRTANQWAWAKSAGGNNDDRGAALAVSGGSVYVTGYISNSNDIQFDAIAVPVTGGSVNKNVFVAKYTDNGTSAAATWVRTGGGTDQDEGTALAVSGSSVYVTGYFTASAGSGASFDNHGFSGYGPTPNQNIFVIKYTDNGASASTPWALGEGGDKDDVATGLAVSSTAVYVTGSFTNDSGDDAHVHFGQNTSQSGFGPTLPGTGPALNRDAFVLKYADNGTDCAGVWAVHGGGNGTDGGQAIAVSGSKVYVTGYLVNDAANSYDGHFGSTVLVGTGTNGVNLDAFVVKYDAGAALPLVDWAVHGGGDADEQGNGLAVSGTGVYVTGSYYNDAANSRHVLFGSAALAGTGSTLNRDVFAAKYTDGGQSAPLAWAQRGGGPGTTSADDIGYGVALSGNTLCLAAATGPAVAAFGPAPQGLAPAQAAVLGQLQAGTGTWAGVVAPVQGGTSQTNATATDALGNVFVTGFFTGQVVFGATVLTSAGGRDVFVAKWNPATSTWAWAQQGGGTGDDIGHGIAASGGNVYVTGDFDNNSQAQFGGTALAAAGPGGPGGSTDVFVAKYVDVDNSATLAWVRQGGGTSADAGYAIAVSGTGVYVTGSYANTDGNANNVQFGGVVLLGTGPNNNDDVFVVKYVDAGAAATVAWVRGGGGTGVDLGQGIALSGSGGPGTSVYVAGSFFNTSTNTNNVRFGGPTGPTLAGTGSSSNADVFVVKYTDNGNAATLAWAEHGGGDDDDTGNAFGIAARNGSVYVTGGYRGTGATSVQFGGLTGPTLAGTGPGLNLDVFVVKYVDSGAAATVAWAQKGGGNADDTGCALALNGNGVYVAGFFGNTSGNLSNVLFGSTVLLGANPTGSIDVFVAKYQDHGPTASAEWAQSGGGNGYDVGYGLAVSGLNIYVAGLTRPVATFGSFTLNNPADQNINFLGQLGETPPAPDLVISTPGQTVPTGTYNSITVTDTGVGTLQGPVVVDTFVDVQGGGTLSTNCQPLTGAASFTLNAGGTLVICDSLGISLNGASGAVQTTGPRSFSDDANYVYNGNGGQYTGNGLPATVRTLTVSTPVSLALSVPALAVRQVVRLTSSGNFELHGRALTLLSDASGTALVANEGAGVVSGNSATMQRYIDASGNTGTSGYRHFSAPVGGSTVADLATTATGGAFTPVVNPAYNTAANPLAVTPFPTVFGYNEAFIAASSATSFTDFDKGYYSPAAPASSLGVGQGYAVQIGNAEKVDFTGTLTTGTRYIGGLSRGSSPAAGWHLVGNPYPSPLDWGTVGAPNTNGSGLDGVEAAAYVFYSTGAYTGQYRAIVNGVGAGTGVMAAGQGFFVRASTAGVPGSITLTNANRLTTFASQVPFQRPAAGPRPLVRLSLGLGNSPATPATAQDETFVYFEAGATAGFDGAFDAHKLANSSGYYLATAAPARGNTPAEDLSIDGRAPLAAGTAEEVVSLRLSVPAGSYTLTATELVNFANLAGGTTVYLRDGLTGTLTDLARQPSYSFAVASGAAGTGRFALVFRPATALAAQSAHAPTSALATVYPNPLEAGRAMTLAVTSLPAGVAQVQATLLNAVGQVVARAVLPVAHQAAQAPVPTAGLASGVYLLRLTTLDAQGQVVGTLPAQRLSLR